MRRDTFMAARLRRDPTPLVLSDDSLFTGGYFRPGSDLHPDGDRIIAPQNLDEATNFVADQTQERYLVVTNWFTELRERLGGN